MRWRAVMGAVVAGLMLAACGSGTGSSSSTPSPSGPPTQLNGPVTIDYWQSYPPPTGLAVQAAVDRFNKIWAGRITVRVSYQGSFDQLAAKVRAAATGGGLPQVVTAREIDVPQYDTAGISVPLDPYVKSARWGLDGKQLADLTPGSLGRTRLPMYGGKTLTWPFGNSAAAWYANQDLLRQAGVTTAPASWDEVAAGARKVRSATGKPGWLMQQNSLGPNFIDVLWTYGVPWLRSGTTTGFDSPQAVRILTTWRKMVQDGSMVLTSSTDQSEFASGAGAMELASSGYAVGTQFGTRIKAFKWSVGNLPHQPGTKLVTELYGSVNTMLKSSPQQQLASWLFMKYFASSANQAAYCAQGGGCIPATTSSMGAPEMKAAFTEDPQFKSAVESVAPYAQLPPQTPAFTEIRGKIANDDVLQVLLGQLSPSDGAKKLAFDAGQALQKGPS